MTAARNKYDLSYIFVGMTPDLWEANYENIKQAVGKYSFEFIIVSPYFPTEALQKHFNVKYIREFGHPSRCLQVASLVAAGEFLTWGSEDYRAEPAGLEKTITLLKGNDYKDVINQLYSEGPGYTGSQYLDDNYWKPYTHPPLRQIAVNPEWSISMTPLLRTAWFRDMGGIDCSYEHFNFNVHDLMFRIQYNGGKIIKSDGKVYSHDHTDPNQGNHVAFEQAQSENDMPRFIEKYSKADANMGPINYLNWIGNTTNLWHRRAKRYSPVEDSVQLRLAGAAFIVNPEPVKLSIVMPGIRPQNWVRAYESILQATKETFELIIVSPFELPVELQELGHVKYIREFGSPTRATQLGTLLAEGQYLFPNFCDDGIFLKDSIDKNLALLLEKGDDIKNIVTCKYSESQNFSHPERWNDDTYYTLVRSYPVNKDITPAEWYVLNNPFWHTAYFQQLGGYSCEFGATPIAHADLAMRAYKDGAHIYLSNEPIMKVDHSQPDHGPIEISQLQYDSPKFQAKYAAGVGNIEPAVSRDNWKESDRFWPFRFKTA